MIARNWLQTLWRTSYKGAAFWVETDTEGGARRIVIHEFPMRDTPYLEDLGERYRDFSVTAYVASDRADSEGAALMAICATRGPGIVVLPTQGPVLVRCLEFSRTYAKDKLGYIAFSLRFVREGFSGALASVTSLINMVFVQAEQAATVVAAVFAATALIKSVPDYVQEALQSSTENALATLEVVRTSTTVDPAVNAAQRNAIIEAYATTPEAIAGQDTAALQAVGQSVVDIAMALTVAMDPAVAVSTMTSILEATPVEQSSSQVVVASIWTPSVITNAQAGNTLLRLAALISYCEAVVKMKLTDRQTAITLRANVSSLFEEQLGALPSDDYELFHAMTKLRDATVEYLSRAIIDLAPIVRVSASLGMPSLFWAWRLYADPTRSTELAERNRVPHPSFMPPSFEALSK
jgi:prophage DNA circulation protein